MRGNVRLTPLVEVGVSNFSSGRAVAGGSRQRGGRAGRRGRGCGIKIAAVARQLGVSRSWASREANAPGTRNLLAELLEPRRERLNALFDQTLDVIEDAMKARKIFVVKGVIVDGGPDHYARLEAAKLFILLMCKAGRTSRTTRRV